MQMRVLKTTPSCLITVMAQHTADGALCFVKPARVEGVGTHLPRTLPATRMWIQHGFSFSGGGNHSERKVLVLVILGTRQPVALTAVQSLGVSPV